MTKEARQVRMLTVSEAAKSLQMDEQEVWYMVWHGSIEIHVRIPEEAVERCRRNLKERLRYK